MGKGSEKREIKKMGIGLAKNSFQVYAADGCGQQVFLVSESQYGKFVIFIQ